MHVMRAHILELDFVFRLQKYVRRETLAFLVKSVHNQHNFFKSTDIFLSNDYYGSSTLSMHSRGLKIYPQCAVRCQSNGREREGSVVTKIVDKEGFLIEVKSFHLRHVIFDKVMFLCYRQSKAEKYHAWVSITKLYLAVVPFRKRHSRRRIVNPPRCCFIINNGSDTLVVILINSSLKCPSKICYLPSGGLFH